MCIKHIINILSKNNLDLKMENDIIKIIEDALGRSLAEEENKKIKEPRSYLAKEIIIDYVKDPEKTKHQLEKYLKSL